MEFKVVKVKEVIINEEKISGIPQFASFLEGKGTIAVVHEKDVSSFTPGDRWELKRLEGQTKIGTVKPEDEGVDREF